MYIQTVIKAGTTRGLGCLCPPVSVAQASSFSHMLISQHSLEIQGSLRDCLLNKN